MMQRLFLFLFTAVFSNAVNCQTSPMVPCKVSFKDGTVLNGSIRHANTKTTPQHFDFYRLDQTKQELEPAATTLVETSDGTVYRSAHLTVYDNITKGAELTEREDELPRTGDFFMERLVKGNTIDLYSIREAAKTHFIIADTAGKLTTLRYIKYVDIALGSFVLREQPIYRDQLWPYINANNQQAATKLRCAKFNTEELVEVITAINQSSELSNAAVNETRKHRIIYPFITAGLGISTARFNGASARLNKMHFTDKGFLFGGAGIEIHPGRKELLLADLYATVSHYSFTAVSASKKNSAGEQVHDQYTLSTTPLAVTLLLNYTLFKGSKAKLLAGAGYSFIINNISTDSFTTTDTNADGSTVQLDQVKLSSLMSQFCFNTDLKLGTKVAIRLIYYPVQGFSGQNSYNFRTSSFQVGFKLAL